ncbi:UNVERIFIED_CONTAM: Retrovirus-related Pol polyprotein from transposon RE1 [Sesamum radiatum]|uniref:Retrovirus-related Pol polyprotein from transposon RE1 n=1 Tax=Sesamum radiatum TaxID=300843 RepID=A0AAW2IUG4_SESRA
MIHGRYKARLVAKGYNQVEEVDYVDKFSPVAKAVTVQVFLALASSYSWLVHQVDINNAFLHGFLYEDIYMQAPAGYSVLKGHVCKLKRSLYGLKQASRQWNLELTSKLLAFGFLQSAHDHCLFIKPTKAGDIISDTGLQSSRPASSPLPPGLKLSAHDSLPLSNAEPYHRLVGRLLYLSFTRPDISFGAQQLSQFVHAPCRIHMDAAMHLVRYLKGCLECCLFFPASNSLSLTAYCDADCASCTDSRRSLTSYCIFLGNALVSWKTKKQTTVARSTTEPEYRSLGSTVCELRWISFLLSDLKVSITTPISLFCVNQTANHIVANSVFHFYYHCYFSVLC